MINPWVILGIVLAWGASLAGVGYKAYVAGEESERVEWQKRDIAIKEAAAEFTKIYREGEAVSSKTLEDKLASLKANERIIEREKLKIIDRPVYRNECLDATGLQYIESARTGGSKADTAKPAN